MKNKYSRTPLARHIPLRIVFFNLLLILSTSSCSHHFNRNRNTAVNTMELNPSSHSSSGPVLKVDHVLIIYLENHSYFNLFATFPNGVLPESNILVQKDEKGIPYTLLPPVLEKESNLPDHRFSKILNNKPYLIDNYVKLTEKVPDPSHEFYTHQVQINGGKNDLFVAYSRVGALPLGYFDMSQSFLWKLAKEYTLADHFFASSFGGSFLNHQWLIAARTPHYKGAPSRLHMQIGANGLPIKGRPLTPDGFAVNSIQPFAPPHDIQFVQRGDILPALEYANIGDRLSEKKISWGWFAGGWKDILAGNNPQDFQYHHQPFLFFKNYGPGSLARKEHLFDEQDLLRAIETNKLPQVSFFKPTGDENAHPGYSTVASADGKVREIIEALQKSPLWSNSLIIITFDEHGGFWDPVSTPPLDRWGPGGRIPAIFVSPLVKKGSIDHTPYETTSILAFLEKRFGLLPLGERDAKANPLTGIWMGP